MDAADREIDDVMIARAVQGDEKFGQLRNVWVSPTAMANVQVS